MMDQPRHVLITGGEGDLARALQTAFTRQGDDVRAPGRKELDVRDEKQVQAYFGALSSLDVLVANAGISRDSTLGQITDADLANVLETNLRGVFLSVRAALKIMLPQRDGHLLLIGSRAMRGLRGGTAYAASKAALVSFSQSVAKEYGGRNIRCNVILPGFLETKMTAALTPQRLEQVRADHALGRFNTPENAARAIAFLARLDHVSGQVFTLDSRIDPWT